MPVASSSSYESMCLTITEFFGKSVFRFAFCQIIKISLVFYYLFIYLFIFESYTDIHWTSLWHEQLFLLFLRRHKKWAWKKNLRIWIKGQKRSSILKMKKKTTNKRYWMFSLKKEEEGEDKANDALNYYHTYTKQIKQAIE